MYTFLLINMVRIGKGFVLDGLILIIDDNMQVTFSWPRFTSIGIAILTVPFDSASVTRCAAFRPFHFAFPFLTASAAPRHPSATDHMIAPLLR